MRELLADEAENVAGSMLDRLLAKFRFIALSSYPDYPDGEADVAPADVSVMATDHEGNIHRAVRATAAEAVDAVMGQERKQWCYGPCGLWKPCTEFARDANRATGRNQRCKVCERERVRRYARAKSGAASLDAPAAGYTKRQGLRDQPVILEFQNQGVAIRTKGSGL